MHEYAARHTLGSSACLLFGSTPLLFLFLAFLPRLSPPRHTARQVYMLLENLLATGLSSLPPAFMHSSATDERLLVLPASAADAARRFRRMVRGNRGGTTFAPPKGEEGPSASGGSASDPTPSPVPETPTSRGEGQFSSAYADPLGAVAFDIPPDALPPPPARAAVARRAPPQLAGPLRPTPPPPAFKGAVDEAAAKPLEAEGFGAFGEVTVMGASGAGGAGGTRSGSCSVDNVRKSVCGLRPAVPGLLRSRPGTSACQHATAPTLTFPPTLLLHLLLRRG